MEMGYMEILDFLLKLFLLGVGFSLTGASMVGVFFALFFFADKAEGALKSSKVFRVRSI